ncbi:hypothetical protein BDW75DRAFT_243368 [Aspergillus navahoensis]
MSHRQSCDRCRQQKVRCIRDEAQAQLGTSYPDRASLAPCERCLKAGVDCVYSLKQRSTRHAAQTSVRKDQNNHSHVLDASWFGTNFPSTAGLNENRAAFNHIDSSWDASLQSLLTPATFFNSLSAVPDLTPVTTIQTSVAPSTALSRPDSSDGFIGDDDDDNDDGDNDKDTSTSLFSQLISLSQRAKQGIRRLARPGQTPLTVSSPEVNEALENTNALIRIMNNITAPISDSDSDDMNINPIGINTDRGLAFLALACHQHLVALFRAICDAVCRCLQDREEHRNCQYNSSEIGPSCVAQFIMVLQLLVHLINRMDRSLAASMNQNQKSPSSMSLGAAGNGNNFPSSAGHHQYDPLMSETATDGSSPPGGLLVVVKEIVGTIPNEHEKLRQVIQKLQTEMEHLDFH